MYKCKNAILIMNNVDSKEVNDEKVHKHNHVIGYGF